MHGQDISRAVEIPLDVPLAPALVALEHALDSRWYGAKKRFADVRLGATDTTWTAGHGPEIRGPVTALLLLSTGRRAGLIEVDGPGPDTVRARMPPPGSGDQLP
ncbi:MAG: hypothetical protein WBM50_02785 [Acidimicrobiales bacterium]